MAPRKSPLKYPPQLLFFPTPLGWMGLFWSGQTVRRLTFGHSDAISAMSTLATGVFSLQEFPCSISVDPETEGGVRTWNVPDRLGQWEADLLGRLRAYADGQIVDFRDIVVDPSPCTPFQARIYALCRQIPYGDTRTYGELARLAGSPQAARAVGQCLARNPIPLLIPCHRVVGAGGKLVGFTAPGGLAMKDRLLRLEANVLHQKERPSRLTENSPPQEPLTASERGGLLPPSWLGKVSGP